VHLVVGRAGDGDAARFRQLFEVRGDVHAVAVEVALLTDHVAEIDADAEADALRNGKILLPLGHAALDEDRAVGGIGRSSTSFSASCGRSAGRAIDAFWFSLKRRWNFSALDRNPFTHLWDQLSPSSEEAD
jgi:hypothetical protein